MYVTRRLSMYRKDPSALSLPPSEGPNSGVLVIRDIEEKVMNTCCFGCIDILDSEPLPFPQNMDYFVQNIPVIFIPVLDQPLSSNLYYCIIQSGYYKGEAYQCSKPENAETVFLYGKRPITLPPQSFDPNNIYQQFKIQRCRGFRCGYKAKSLASDGFLPMFLWYAGWGVYYSIPNGLPEAPGIDNVLREKCPAFNFPLSAKSCTPVQVGKWLVPLMFIKYWNIAHRQNRSLYYEMILEQHWEQIYFCPNWNDEGNAVTVDVDVEVEEIEVDGKKVKYDKEVDKGVMWFRSMEGVRSNMGLSMGIVERMRWEEERFGWVNNGEKGNVRVKRVEEFGGEWKKFGCYVLAERFVLKRVDGSLLLTHNFRHTQHLRTKWEC